MNRRYNIYQRMGLPPDGFIGLLLIVSAYCFRFARFLLRRIRARRL